MLPVTIHQDIRNRSMRFKVTQIVTYSIELDAGDQAQAIDRATVIPFSNMAINMGEPHAARIKDIGHTHTPDPDDNDYCETCNMEICDE